MKILKLRFKLQKNQTSKLQKNVKKVKSHTFALEHAFVQKSTKKTKNILKIKKKQKNYYYFSLSILTLKFLTTIFLLRNIYQLSNDNINYLFT
jgi:hypothetical protein